MSTATGLAPSLPAEIPVPAFDSRPPLPPILVADDDPDDLYFAVRLIKRTGTAHPVLTFSDGVGVVEYLTRTWLAPVVDRRSLPRLLFLDLKMSGLGGFGFLEWVRHHRALSPLNVIVLSGSNRNEDVVRARELGAKRYLVKHPSLSTFTTIVHSVYADQVQETPVAATAN